MARLAAPASGCLLRPDQIWVMAATCVLWLTCWWNRWVGGDLLTWLLQHLTTRASKSLAGGYMFTFKMHRAGLLTGLMLYKSWQVSGVSYRTRIRGCYSVDQTVILLAARIIS
jgi:hypothetical protein